MGDQEFLSRGSEIRDREGSKVKKELLCLARRLRMIKIERRRGGGQESSHRGLICVSEQWKAVKGLRCQNNRASLVF